MTTPDHVWVMSLVSAAVAVALAVLPRAIESTPEPQIPAPAATIESSSVAPAALPDQAVEVEAEAATERHLTPGDLNRAWVTPLSGAPLTRHPDHRAATAQSSQRVTPQQQARAARPMKRTTATRTGRATGSSIRIGTRGHANLKHSRTMRRHRANGINRSRAGQAMTNRGMAGRTRASMFERARRSGATDSDARARRTNASLPGMRIKR